MRYTTPSHHPTTPSSDFYTFYVDVPLSLSCIIQKVSAAYCAGDIAIRGNGTGWEYMCPTGHENICAPLGTLSTFTFNPVFQLSTAKNEINLFNNHVLIVAPVTFAPVCVIPPSADFLFGLQWHDDPKVLDKQFTANSATSGTVYHSYCIF